MKKKIGWIFLIVLVVILSTGCSDEGETAGTPKPPTGAAIGEVVSESAVVQKVSEPLVKRKSRYANTDNMYQVGKEGGILERCNMEGTVLESIIMDIDEVSWVTDHWLYYIRGVDGVLCRIPIEKSAGGDILRQEKEERLPGITKDSAVVVYAGDTWLLMLVSDNYGESALFKYDIEKRMPKELIGPEENVWVYFTEDEYPAILEDGLVVMSEKKVFHLNPVTEENKLIYSSNRMNREWHYSGDVLYFRVESDLYLYDGISEKAKCILAESDIIEKCERQRNRRLQYAWIRSMYIYQGRWYFYVHVREENENKGKEDEELYSISIDKHKKIKYEEKMMNYFEQKSEYRKEYNGYAGIDGYYVNKCRFVGFSDGKVLASYPEGGNTHYIVYDLATKRLQDVTKDRLPESCQDLVNGEK